MPFVIVKEGNRGYCVYTQGEDGNETGDTHGCHATYEEARQQQKALYANVPDARKATLTQAQRDKLPASDFGDPSRRLFPITDQNDVDSAAHLIGKAQDPEAVKRRIIAIAKRKGLKVPDAWAEGSGKSEALMITLGPAVKACGDGKISGYLVTWGNEATKDSDGEWFTSDTDFDTVFPARASVYYHHGQDPAIGRQRLTHGAMDSDDFGVRIDAQLNLRDPKQAAIYRRVEKGELGWSSGSLPHITIPPRENPGGAIKQWPLGHDASLTWIPSDKRNLAIAMKSAPLPAVEELLIDDAPRLSLNEKTDRISEDLEILAADYRTHAVKAGAKISGARRERLRQVRDLIDELLTETEPRDAAAASTDAASSPVMGEGAEVEKQTTVTGLSLPTLPDLSDLYATAMRQYTEAAALPTGV